MQDWEEFNKGGVMREILTVLAEGGELLLASLTQPRTGLTNRFVRDYQRALERDRGARFKAKIRSAVAKLEEQRLVGVKKTNGDIELSITEDGQRRLKRYDTKLFVINPPKAWDGKWRIVGFDIPERWRQARDSLRDLLKRLGFYPLQKSVWVIPWPCRDEIEVIRYAYALEKDLWFCETDTLDREVELIEHFDLTLYAARHIPRKAL